MRITQNMLNTQFLQDLNRNLHRLSQYQEKLSTGLKVNRASDDPVAVTSILRYREELAANTQYQRNADDAMSYLNQYDTVFGQINQILQRARELAVRGANGSHPPSALDAIAQEVEQLHEELVSVANSQFNGKYVFNGLNTSQIPYQYGSAESDIADPGAIFFEVSAGLNMQINVSGVEVFGTADSSENAFLILRHLQQSLKGEAGYSQADISAVLGRLETRMEDVQNQWAEMGARMNRLELVQNRLKDTDYHLQTLLSKTQDVDIAQAVMEMKMSENVYQAALSTGAKIIQPSLVDFLR